MTLKIVRKLQGKGLANFKMSLKIKERSWKKRNKNNVSCMI